MSRSAASEAGKAIVFLPSVISVLAVVVGVATAYAPHDKVGLYMWGVKAIYIACGAVFAISVCWQIWILRKKPASGVQELAEPSEDPRRKLFAERQRQWRTTLEESAKCPATDCIDPWRKRRDFYRPLSQFSIKLAMECDACFNKHFKRWPQIQHPKLRVWPDNLPCSDPGCKEPAVNLGVDDNPYCIAHMHKGGASKETVIASTEAPLTQVILIPGRESERPNMSNESLIDRFAKSHRRD